jgi:hypothetical protein
MSSISGIQMPEACYTRSAWFDVYEWANGASVQCCLTPAQLQLPFARTRADAAAVAKKRTLVSRQTMHAPDSSALTSSPLGRQHPALVLYKHGDTRSAGRYSIDLFCKQRAVMCLSLNAALRHRLRVDATRAAAPRIMRATPLALATADAARCTIQATHHIKIHSQCHIHYSSHARQPSSFPPRSLQTHSPASTKLGCPSLPGGCCMTARASPSSDHSLTVPSLLVDMKPRPGTASRLRTGPVCSRSDRNCLPSGPHSRICAQSQ